jgi:hypothetical protein
MNTVSDGIDQHRSPIRWWTIAAAIAIAGAGLVAWYFSRSPPVPIRTAVAISLRSTPSSFEGASLLDASGYIVARRRATAASRITGKVIEVSLEEGQRVERVLVDCNIATLADSANRTELMSLCWRKLVQAAVSRVTACLAWLDAIQLADWRAARLLFNRMLGP